MQERKVYQSPTVTTVMLAAEDVVRTSTDYDKGSEDIFSTGEVKQVWVQ